MEKKWTDSQRKAIETRTDNLLVSAAAGSGKTALLIERIFRIVQEENIDVSQLLVLTFTRSAAGEMKNRLNQAFSRALETADYEKRSAILRQMSLLGNASISTFHVFCLNLLRLYFYKIDLDPGFVIGNDIEMSLLRREALEEVFEAYYIKAEKGQGAVFLQLVDKYAGNRNDENLKDLVEQFYFFLTAQPYSEKWCQEALALFDIKGENFKNHLWGQKTKEILLFKLKSARNMLTEALELSEVEGFEKAYQMLEEETAAVIAVITDLEGGLSFSETLEKIRNIGFKRFSGNKKADEIRNEEIKEARNQGKKEIEGISKAFWGDINNQIAELALMGPLMEMFVELTFAMMGIYQEKKKEKNALDYSDLEQLTLKLLEDDGVAEEVKNQYAYVFIDEYQDTNEMQETILQKIVRPDNFFMVGDVKQSIYRFRLADPGIFMNKYDQFGDQEKMTGKLINLNRNFRSSEAVINSVNQVFQAIMSKNLGEIDYNEQVSLNPGIQAQIKQEKTEICLLELSDGNDKDDEQEEMSKTKREALYIATRIQNMIGRSLFRSREGVQRPVEYRDIGILLRSVAGKEEIFLEVFREQGIPVYFEGGSEYYESLEIKTILNLLNIIDNGHQDIPLLSVLVSPIGQFTTEDCTLIRISYPDGFFYEAVAAYHNEQKDELAKRLGNFYEKIGCWQNDSRQLPVEDFLWKIYMESDYYDFVGALPGGEQRQNNLKILLKRAADYKKSTLRGIYQFIRFIENMKKHQQDVSPSQSLSDQENVVRLMTIHKSKGLEFPVVFIAGLNQRFNTRDNYRSILFHKKLGICPEYVDEEKRFRHATLAKEVCKNQNLRELLSEEMRILYVGMTRAEEKLILAAGIKMSDSRLRKWQREPSEDQLLAASGFLDWIMIAVLDKSSLNDEGVTELEHFTIRQILPDSEIKEAESDVVDELTQEKQSDEKIEKEVATALAFDYHKDVILSLPGKMSVTEIKNYQTSEKKNIPIAEVIQNQNGGQRRDKPLFMEKEDETLTATQKGTALHLLMEILNLEDLKKVVLACQPEEEAAAIDHFLEAERNRLIRDEYLPEMLAKSIDTKKITSFYQSKIGKRILEADVVKREWAFNYLYQPQKIRSEWKEIKKPVLIQGVIDCAFMEDDKWVIVDYKTDFFMDEEDRINRIKSYRLQVELYAEAIEELTKISVKEKIISFIRMRENISLK